MKKPWLQVKRKGWLRGALIATVLTALGGLGATYTYNQHNTELKNMLRASSVAGAVIENGEPAAKENQFRLEPGVEVSKLVQFKNTGEAPVFVRVAFSETVMGADNVWLVNNYNYINLHWTTSWEIAWELKNDGWYYYKKILPSEEMTEAVLSHVEIASLDEIPSEYRNSNYQLAFTMEVLQYSEEQEVNEKALEKAFGRTATVTDGAVVWK